MEDGGPSQTARRVAAHRLDFTRIPADYGDPAADHALAVDVAAGRQAPANRMHDYLAARTAFFDGFQVGCLVAAGVLFIGAAFVARFLPARPTPPPELAELAELEHLLALEPLTTTPHHEHDSAMVHKSND